MSEEKNLLIVLGEWWVQRRKAQAATPSNPPSRLRRFLRWMVPNGGTLLVVLVLVLTQRIWAGSLASPANVPGPSATTINYQGRLADPAGNPLDGNYGMTFSLWDASTGGTLVWEPENHTAVPVSNGLFSVGLGSQTPGGIPTTIWDGDRYLEITVGGETLSPRELLRSVPIAGMALTVPDSAIKSRHLAPSWYEDYNPSTIETTSTDPVPTDVSVTFTCDNDCTALILHRSLVQHSLADGAVVVRIMVDGSYAFYETGVPNAARFSPGNNYFHEVSGYDFVNLSAGPHTVAVEFFCATVGTCYYYGAAEGGAWEHLNVLVFAQP